MPDTHTIRLITRDNKEINFACAADESLIDGAEREGFTLPAICRAGDCGACLAHCRDGRYELKSYSLGNLSNNAEGHAGILMCRTYPRGPLTIEITAELAQISSCTISEPVCEVVAIDDMGGQVRRLLLKVLPDESGTVNCTFDSGQFMELELPGTDIRRAYSFCNAPNSKGELEFLIRLQPNGKFSTWLLEHAKVGGRLNTRGPEGSFVLREDNPAPRRFVAGGTGIAPIFSMLRLMGKSGEKTDAHLYFGVTTEADIFALAEIEELKAALPNLSVDVCVWKANADWKGFAGSPVDALKTDLVNDMSKGVMPEIYLCGPPGLVDATQAMVEELGVPHENIFSERFLAG